MALLRILQPAVTIIIDPIIKQHIEAAEAAIETDQFESAVRLCRNAFEEAVFKYRKRSSLALTEVPARVELARIAPETERCISLFSQELDALRMKIDANRLQRFKEITKHLPSKPNEEPYGYAVLQRPWKKTDASYCYGFVAENVLRWQDAEFEPLYDLSSSDSYHHEESIDQIKLSHEESGCLYYREHDHRIHLIYTSRETRDQLQALVPGKVYRWFSQSYKNGALTSEIIYQVRLRFVKSELITHDPVRWRVFIDISQEPLTWYRRDFEDGQVTSETPSLQNCTADDLIELYPVDADAANRVIAVRDQHGLLNIELLRQIDGLTKEQLRWIESFTRG